jgi:hypothetical protein
MESKCDNINLRFENINLKYMKMLDIEKAVKYQFNDPDWKKKLIPLMVFTALAFFLYFAGFMSMYILPLVSEGSDATIAIVLVTFLCLFFLSMILFIGWSVFMSGYSIELIGMVKKDPDTKLPEAAPVMPKIKRGIEAVLVALVPHLFAMALMFIVMLFIIFLSWVLGGFNDANSPVFPILIMIFYFLGFGVFMVYTILYTYLYVPAANYVYMKKGLKAAFAFKEIIDVIKRGWKNLAFAALIIYAGAMVSAFIIYIPCIGWLAYPAVLVLLMNSSSHLYGQVFAELDKEELASSNKYQVSKEEGEKKKVKGQKSK